MRHDRTQQGYELDDLLLTFEVDCYRGWSLLLVVLHGTVVSHGRSIGV
jgi:hypothetical protein